MSDQQLAHKDVDGVEYVRERSGNQERLVKADRGFAPLGLLGVIRTLLGRR